MGHKAKILIVLYIAGIYRNYTEGVDKNALCDETELDMFCKHVSFQYLSKLAFVFLFHCNTCTFLLLYSLTWIHLSQLSCSSS